MQDKEKNIGIKEIQNIKMTLNEKENILKTVLNSSVPATKPIKSPYAFVSIFQRNHLAYYAMALCLVIIILGGGITFTYFQGQNIQNSKIARLDTEKINTFSQNTNTSLPPNKETKNTKNTSKPVEPSVSSPSIGAVPQNRNYGIISSPGPTAGMMAPTAGLNNITGNQKTYQGNEFSFNYDSSAKITTEKTLHNGSDVQVSVDEKYNNVRFYPKNLSGALNLKFFTDTVVINGKTFYFGDTQIENKKERSYMYKKDGKTIVIVIVQNDYLIDLNSVEIN